MQLSENSGEKKLSLVVQVSELREWGIEEDQDLGFLKSFLGNNFFSQICTTIFVKFQSTTL